MTCLTLLYYCTTAASHSIDWSIACGRNLYILARTGASCTAGCPIWALHLLSDNDWLDDWKRTQQKSWAYTWRAERVQLVSRSETIYIHAPKFDVSARHIVCAYSFPTMSHYQPTTVCTPSVPNYLSFWLFYDLKCAHILFLLWATTNQLQYAHLPFQITCRFDFSKRLKYSSDANLCWAWTIAA
jgi:hypothetical protein